MRVDPSIEGLLRQLAPQALGALVRRTGHFDACEDAVQEALLAAALQWPEQGIPQNPRGWLVTVAYRRLADEVRSEQARRRRQELAASTVPLADRLAAAPGEAGPTDRDDTLTLLFLCCHPALTPASQIALTLRAVGGLTTAQIASSFLVPEATMAQRISRAKARIKAGGAEFSMPPTEQRMARLAVVLQVLYLIFNEGYTTTSGDQLLRAELTGEAIRLARLLHRALPADGEVDTAGGEVAGLLALMVLTDARRLTRTGIDGSLLPLDLQDRSRWDRAAIAEGVDLVSRALARTPLGPYQLQAAIAALHAEAPTAEDTDWPQVLALYELLDRASGNPMVTLNRAVAVAMVHGPSRGLDLLATLDDDGRLNLHHRLPAVRGHLLEMDGDVRAAREQYLLAARRTASLPERRYLTGRAAALNDGDPAAKNGAEPVPTGREPVPTVRPAAVRESASAVAERSVPAVGKGPR